MSEHSPHHGPAEVPVDVPVQNIVDGPAETVETGATDEPVEATVTDKAPVKRNGFNRRGFRFATPLGDIAIAIRTPKQRPVVPKWFDPLGLTDRAVDAAKTGLKLAEWGE